METVWWSELDSDLGRFGLASTEKGLAAILLPRSLPDRDRVLRHWLGEVHIQPDDGPNAGAIDQLQRYLDGELRVFDLEYDMRGTDFQRRVWQAVGAVPWGETRSYLDIAIEVGNPKSVRAVGAANGANPLPVMIPCHRIIGADGSLTGYGGGLELKERLLKLEGISSEKARTMPLFADS